MFRRLRRRVFVLSLLALVCAPALSQLQDNDGALGEAAREAVAAVTDMTGSTGSASAANTSHGSTVGTHAEHSFLGTDDGRPITWDRCSPIRYVVNQAFVDAGLLDDLHAAIGRIEANSGFRFEHVAAADVIPTSSWRNQWPGFQAPLAFALADRASTDLIGPHAAATGGGDVSSVDGHKQFTSGSVATDTLDRYAHGFGPGTTGGLVLHETLHVLGLGLGHIDDSTSVLTTRIDGRLLFRQFRELAFRRRRWWRMAVRCTQDRSLNDRLSRVAPGVPGWSAATVRILQP